MATNYVFRFYDTDGYDDEIYQDYNNKADIEIGYDYISDIIDSWEDILKEHEGCTYGFWDLISEEFPLLLVGGALDPADIDFIAG